MIDVPHLFETLQSEIIYGGLRDEKKIVMASKPQMKLKPFMILILIFPSSIESSYFSVRGISCGSFRNIGRTMPWCNPTWFRTAHPPSALFTFSMVTSGRLSRILGHLVPALTSLFIFEQLLTATFVILHDSACVPSTSATLYRNVQFPVLELPFVEGLHASKHWNHSVTSE
jgi:hypothetical protein